jgi:quercetin dioxygenase-like cupin family protein
MPQRLPAPTTGPDLEFNFVNETARLRSERAYHAGRNAKTLVKHPDFRVVLTVIRAGSRVAAHQAAGRVSVQCLEGHIIMHVPGKTVDLPAGSLVALDRALPHDVEALKDSVFLVTIAWPENFDHQWNVARPCD